MKAADLYAVGVMGLMWLNNKHNMPFGQLRSGPQKKMQGKDISNEVQHATGFEAACRHVAQLQGSLVSFVVAVQNLAVPWPV